MGLSFTGTADRVDHGSGTSLDNLAAGTCLAWVYRTADVSSQQHIFSKESATRYFRYDNGTGRLEAEIARATTSTFVESTGSAPALNTWTFLAWVFDTAAADGDQHLYKGTLSALASESSYTTQRVGSGALTSEGTDAFIVGNRAGEFAQFGGRIDFLAYYNRAMTLAEIQSHQFHPFVANGCVLFTWYGHNGTGTQPDWSGTGNNGTVTSSAVADGVPIQAHWGYEYEWEGALGAVVLNQEGFRYFNDDGNEAGSTGKALQDVDITETQEVLVRPRILVDATGNPLSQTFQLENRPAAGAWYKVPRWQS